MADTTATESGWRLDKRVPIVGLVTMVGALCLQTISFVWWAGGINNRVDTLENARADAAAVEARVRSVEYSQAVMERASSDNTALLRRIDDKLDRVSERQAELAERIGDK